MSPFTNKRIDAREEKGQFILLRQMKNRYFIFAILIGLLLFIAQPTLASQNSAEIFNNVKVEANTGNNSGAIKKEGRSSIDVKIEQTINGEVLPIIEISTSSENGESRSIEFHSENATGSVKTDIKINATVNQPPNQADLQEQQQKTTSSVAEEIKNKLQSKYKENSFKSFLFNFSQSLNSFKLKLYNYVSKFFR